MTNTNISLFKIAHLIRSSQQIIMDNYHPEDLMKCPIHFCEGQEALCAALSLELLKNDYLLSHHRSHGYFLAKKCPVSKMIKEFYGKAEGTNSGLTGSQELSYHNNKFYSGTILSGMFAISLGTAYKQKINKDNNITFTVIGDGGMEEGICYEALNLASLHKLPIIFICENNRYSVHTNISERSNQYNFKKKVKSFDIDYLKITEFRIDKIHSLIKKKISAVRKNKKPLFIEFDTMRTCGHVGPENDDLEYNYRSKELKKWHNKDCLKDLSKKINNTVRNKIIKSNVNLIEKSIFNAKKGSVLDFNESLDYNFIKKYSKIIKHFTPNKVNFKVGQKETKLKPY